MQFGTIVPDEPIQQREPSDNRKLVTAIGIVLLGGYLFFSLTGSHNSHSDDESIVAAAEDGVVQQMGSLGPMGPDGAKNWHKTLSSYEHSIVRVDDNKADVYFMAGNSVMDHETVVKDEDGQWHPQ